MKRADGSWADDGVVFANAVVQVNFHKPVVISSIENVLNNIWHCVCVCVVLFLKTFSLFCWLSHALSFTINQNVYKIQQRTY